MYLLSAGVVAGSPTAYSVYSVRGGLLVRHSSVVSHHTGFPLGRRVDWSAYIPDSDPRLGEQSHNHATAYGARQALRAMLRRRRG